MLTLPASTEPSKQPADLPVLPTHHDEDGAPLSHDHPGTYPDWLPIRLAMPEDYPGGIAAYMLDVLKHNRDRLGPERLATLAEMEAETAAFIEATNPDFYAYMAETAERDAKLSALFGPDRPPAEQPPAVIDGLVYDRELVWIYGRPGGGKSWAAVVMAANVERCLYIAYERGESTRRRMQHIPHPNWLVVDAHQLTTVNDDGDLIDSPLVAELIKWLSASLVPLVVIDSATSAGCTTDGTNIVSWYAKHIARWHRHAAVVVIDHVPRQTSDDRLEGPLGSVTKNGYADAMYAVSRSPHGGELIEAVTLTVTKTNETWHKGATMHLQDHSIGPPAPTSGPEAVARYVRDNPGQKTNEVANHVPGTKTERNAAVTKAEKEGLIIRIEGPNNSLLCYPPDYAE